MGNSKNMALFSYENAHRFGIPYSNNMIISSNQLCSFRIKSLMPLDVQYWAAIPIKQRQSLQEKKV